MDRYFLEHLTQLGEVQSVRALEDIKSVQGIKLIARGTEINRSHLERLLQHKLLKPIDNSLIIADQLSVTQLKYYALKSLDDSPNLRLLIHGLSDISMIMDYFSSLLLSRFLANKMTIMQKCLPNQFTHSLWVALMNLLIGNICRMSLTDMHYLASIGLFHDLGTLHIDPHIFDESKCLSFMQWKQVYAHPIIGCLILKEQQELPPAISRAVLEHHERIDGSGYPRQLKAPHLSRLGRITAIAETIMGISRKGSCEYLITILKSDINKLDKEILELLCHAFYQINLIGLAGRIHHTFSPVPMNEMKQTLKMAETISLIFVGWDSLLNEGLQQNFDQLINTIDDLHHILDRAGISVLDTTTSVRQYEQDLPAFI